MDNKPALCIKPLIIKKRNIRILKPNIKNELLSSENLCKEDVLHDTTDMYFLKGEYQRLLLVNRLNMLTKQSRTVAKYFSKDGTVVEKTSDTISEVLGQDQYKTIFTALCSILDQELKLRSILALLTFKSEKVKIESEQSLKTVPMKIFVDCASQTDEMRIEKAKPRKRIRKPVSPYIVPDDTDSPEKELAKRNVKMSPLINTEVKRRTNRIIVDVKSLNTTNSGANNLSGYVTQDTKNIPLLLQNNDFISNTTDSKSTTLDQNSKSSIKKQQTDTPAINWEAFDLPKEGSLPELSLSDEFSNGSNANLSVLSDTPTNPELLNPSMLLNSMIDQRTKVNLQQNVVHTLYRVPGTDISVPFKPEDMFHIASKANLRYLDAASQMKLKHHQLQVDLQQCLTPQDEYGNLPIHMAVIDDDMELLVRQCIVLKLRGATVDVLANGQTALNLSILSGRATHAACLVRRGACPLRSDDEHRAATHHAAAEDADVLTAVLKACRDQARKILHENDDLWKPEMENQSDEELSKHLMDYMCSMFDKQGYNPLMIASKLGLYANVRVLLEHSSNANDRMPTSGNTALYLAVAAACNSSIENGNKSTVVDRFSKTIDILLQNGADPYIENNSGTNVQSLLQDIDNPELYMLIASKGTKQRPPIQNERDIAKVMLVLSRDGHMHYENLENDKKKRNVKAKPVKDVKPVKNVKSDVSLVKNVKPATGKKLVIVENVVLKPGNTDANQKIDKPKKGKQTQNKIVKIVTNKKSQAVKRKQNDSSNDSKAKMNK